MKLRLLNGSHSALAYLGYLAGYETVADAMRDPRFARFARGVMDEAAPTLHDAAGADLAAYSARCSSASPTPRCTTAPGRSRWTARRSCRSACSARSSDRLRLGAADRHASRSRVAGWMRYVTGIDEKGGRSTCAIPLRRSWPPSREGRPGRGPARACAARRALDLRRVGSRRQNA